MLFRSITPHRQGYGAHTFNLSTDPVQIVYSTFDISVDDRKNSMKSAAGFGFQQVVREQTQLQMNSNPDEQYDAAAVETARQDMIAKQAQIDACTTHDELDALM